MQTNWTTPPTLAADLGITRQGVRAWLIRNGHTTDADGFYRIDSATEAEMRAHFALRSSTPPCRVDGCDKLQVSRRSGLCSMHRERLKRHGTLERQEPGENQRSKTHCPQGHEYTPENTYRFGDGRRRCRRCRLDQAAAAHAARH